MLQVVAATRTAMMVVVESYDAYVLEEYAGSTLACVHHGEEGVKENLDWFKDQGVSFYLFSKINELVLCFELLYVLY